MGGVDIEKLVECEIENETLPLEKCLILFVPMSRRNVLRLIRVYFFSA